MLYSSGQNLERTEKLLVLIRSCRKPVSSPKSKCSRYSKYVVENCTDRARWLAGKSIMNNLGSKLKFQHTHPVGNLLLLRSMGRATHESMYPRRKFVNNNGQKCTALVLLVHVVCIILDQYCVLDKIHS